VFIEVILACVFRTAEYVEYSGLIFDGLVLLWMVVLLSSLTNSQVIVFKATKLMHRTQLKMCGFVSMIAFLMITMMFQVALILTWGQHGDSFFVFMFCRDVAQFLIKGFVLVLVESYSSDMQVTPVMNENEQTCFYCYDGKTQRMLF
jgi:hypothetical protein